MENEGHWPKDAIVEILVRLPIKSIIRNKSTCKSWYSLIRSRYFIEFHRRFQLLGYDDSFISCIGPVLAAYMQESEFITQLPEYLTRRDICLPRNLKLSSSKVYGAMSNPLNNGICCLVVEEFVLSRERFNPIYRDFKFALCNFATRDFNVLSRFPLIRVSRPNDSDSVYYGISSIHKKICESHQVAVDYKIIVIDQPRSNSVIAHTYSLKRGSWKQICDSSIGRNYSKALDKLVNEHGELQFPDIIRKPYLSHDFLN